MPKKERLILEVAICDLKYQPAPPLLEATTDARGRLPRSVGRTVDVRCWHAPGEDPLADAHHYAHSGRRHGPGDRPGHAPGDRSHRREDRMGRPRNWHARDGQARH